MIHKHFKTRDNFDQEFFKFPSTISDNDICFIKDTGEIWTHGKFYAQTDSVLESISELEDQSEVIASALVDLNESFEDLGKVFLKENIVNGANVLTQEMLSSANTIYSISYDYVCNSSITIPSNCVLEFNGGSISGGTITLQNTKLDGDVKWGGTTISGSCSNDLLTPQMFGAYPTLTETESNKTQHTLAFLNLARVVNNPNTSSKTIFASAGHYSINSEINFTTSCRFYGDGNLSIIDIYDGSGTIIFGDRQSNGSSVCTRLDTTITADVHKLDRKIVVNNTTGLNVGDYLIINDSKNGSFNNSRNYYRTCECIRIKKIVENNIYIDDVLYGDYFVNFGENYTTSFDPSPSSRTIISKFTPYTFNISDFRVLSHEHNNNPSAYYSFVVRGFENSKITNVTVENYGNKVAANISLGLNYEVEKCTIRSFVSYVTGADDAHDTYGLVISTSQNFVVRNSTFRANSHALASGAGDHPAAIQNRNFIYDNLHFETSEKINYNLDDEYTFIDLDIHGAAEYYKIINTIAPQTSCDTGGYNIVVEGCKLYRVLPVFNIGDFTVRNCEIFCPTSQELLFSNNNRENENGNNAVMIENNIFHGAVNFNFQNSEGNGFIKPPYEYFFMKNNIFHDSIRIRHGYIKNLIFENNFLYYGDFDIPTNEAQVETLSIKNNVVNDGRIFLGLTNIIAEGVVSNNTIVDRTVKVRDVYYVLCLSSFKGNIQGNSLISYVDNYYDYSDDSRDQYNRPNRRDYVEVLAVRQNSDVQIYDNILKKGTGYCRHALIAAMSNSKVICDRNTHNSIRTSYINEASECHVFSTYFNNLTSINNVYCDLNTLGRPVYNNYDHTLYYTSNKINSDYIFSEKVYNETPKTVAIGNKLTYGNSYVFSVGGAGEWRFELYFSKYDMSNENFNENELVPAVTEAYPEKNYVFTAENPIIYPYLYMVSPVTSPSGGYRLFRIYDNNVLSCYDGANFGVKRMGTTAERPSNKYDIYEGFKYYDTDLNKELVASKIIGSRIYWREYDGAMAGIKRIGTTLERPSGTYNPTANPSLYPQYDVDNIYVGFKYIDTTIGKEIYASAINGSTVTWTELSGSQIEYQYN